MSNKKKLKVKNNTAAVAANHRILNDDSSFDITEAYKSIRTNILFSMPASERGKVIMITSAAPGEGKTTTTTNLAITFSQIGAKVILIDADLRASRLMRYLNMKNADGLSNLLCGFSNFESTVQRNVRPNLDVLSAGKTPPNPAELFESPGFSALIDGLRDRYDYIFIDTPPIAAITDAAIITKNCDGAVLIVHEGLTNYDALDAAVDTLRHTGAKLLGLINVGIQRVHSHYGYYRYAASPDTPASDKSADAKGD